MWKPDEKNGLWVWYLGDGSVVDQAAAAGYDYLLVKAGDNGNRWDQFSSGLVDRCHNKGMACVAWTYAYLADYGTEVAVALNALSTGADGLVIDVEYEAVNRVNEGQAFCDTLLANRGDTWLGYSPDFRIAFGNQWPRGNFNPYIEPWPWEAFNQLDGVLPQLYWTDFAQSYQTTLDMVLLWEAGCAREGWRVPPSYPVFPSTASVHEILGAADYAASLGITGANTWRWGSGLTASQMALAGYRQWPSVPGEPIPGEGDDDEMLRPYIEEMGSPEGSVVIALQNELDKPKPSRREIRNIMNRLIALRNEALGE